MADEEEPRGEFSTQYLRPRDVIAPISTLIGLMLTAIGVVSYARSVSGVLFEVLVLVIAIVIVTLAASAIHVLMHTIARKEVYWDRAIRLFVASWFVLGAGIFIALLTLAFPNLLQGISVYEVEITVLSLVYLVTYLVMFEIFRRRRKSRSILAKEAKRLPSEEIIKSQVDKSLDEDDVQVAFIRLAIDAERSLREVAVDMKLMDKDERISARKIVDRLSSKGVIDSRREEIFGAVWNVRNQLVHGTDVPISYVKDGIVALRELLDYFDAVNDENKARIQ